MAHFNHITLEPATTYATEANAVKAVRTWVDKHFPKTEERLFNILVLRTEAGRFYPLMINIDPKWFPFVCRAPFHKVN